MASVEVSIGVHEGPHTAAAGWFLKDWSPWISRRTGERKLYVLTITLVSLYPVLFRGAERRQEWSEIKIRIRGWKDIGSMLVFLLLIYFYCQ